MAIGDIFRRRDTGVGKMHKKKVTALWDLEEDTKNVEERKSL